MKLADLLLPLVVVAVLGLAASTASAAPPAGVGGTTPPGDLEANWGTTPAKLRPLFRRMEEAAGIAGSARWFAIVAARESNFVATAHNDSDGEVDASRRAYDNNAASKPPLEHAAAARDFGSGGLFARLGPYFLWSGTEELGAAAPLLGLHPSAIFDPRLAGFAAVVMLRRLVTIYQARSLVDARVGWAAINLLGDPKAAKYLAVRDRFLVSAAKLGVDLAQLPAKFEAGPWPGAAGAFELMTSLPPPAT